MMVTSRMDKQEHNSSQSHSWMDKMLDSLQDKEVSKSFQCATTVSPCIIDGDRVLIYENGLEKNKPDAYMNLKSFAEENKFKLKEDQRNKQSQDYKSDRRKTDELPMLLLSDGIYMEGESSADSMKYLKEKI